MNAIPLAEVLIRPDVWRGDQVTNAKVPTVASSFESLDAELPGGGWTRGTLTEVLADGAGHGECSLVLPALIRVQSEGRWIVLVAPPYAVNAPAWVSAGIDLARLVVAAPTKVSNALWAAEQTLASGSPGAVLFWAKHIDARQVRRLQVAAAQCAGLAFLFRPCQAGSESSPAPLRLKVMASECGRLGVQVLKRRGSPCRSTLQLDVPCPVARRNNHDSITDLACPPSAVPPSRSPCTLVLA